MVASATASSSAKALPVVEANPEADCKLLNKLQVAHFGKPPSWPRWIYPTKVPRDVAWCEKRHKALAGLSGALDKLVVGLSVEKHRAWAKKARGFVGQHQALVLELCTSFKKPPKKAPPSTNRYVVKADGPVLGSDEYAILDKLRLVDGKIGYVMPAFSFDCVDYPD